VVVVVAEVDKVDIGRVFEEYSYLQEGCPMPVVVVVVEVDIVDIGSVSEEYSSLQVGSVLCEVVGASVSKFASLLL